MSFKNVTFGWSEICLLGSVALFFGVAKMNMQLWIPIMLLTFSIMGKFIQYSIEIQKEKELNNDIETAITNMFNPESSQQKTKDDLNDINKAIEDFSNYLNVK